MDPLLMSPQPTAKTTKKLTGLSVSFVSPIRSPRPRLARSASFTSPTSKKMTKRNATTSDLDGGAGLGGTSLKSQSMHMPRTRRPHVVDGNPLPHWDPRNFETQRDASCRKVYVPKEEETIDDFFKKHLDEEEFRVMRKVSVEQPYFSKYNRFFPKKGHFCCKGCGNALYSYQSKFENCDGWPAFGECIDGAIEMVTAEQRQQERERRLAEERREAERLEEQRRKEAEARRQLEQEQRVAAITIQRLIRGALCRIRVAATLDQLIAELQSKEELAKWEEDLADEPWDVTLSRHSKMIDKLSCHSRASDTSFFDDFSDDDEDSFASFGEEDYDSDDIKGDNNNNREAQRDWIPDEPEDDRNEIHCHRCKSHLGSVKEMEGKGRRGETYREHHRVNGRAIKYVEDNVSKRANIHACLLFANKSQARLMGLRAKEKDAKKAPVFRRTSNVPFVSPRTQKKKLAQAELSKSTHAKASGRKFAKNSSLEQLLMSRSMH